ncbi:MAG: tetratricopeptide repeat protein [Cyclobacteriaceae bacterium]|nr:tetratricopeptide repeat protein [Cyclobacteriaceae bacterium HetDA_MAG_MS6]
MKKISLSIIIFLSATRLLAQEDLNEKQYRAYLANDIEGWQEVYKKSKDSNLERYDQMLMQYGLLNACMAEKNEDLFEEHVDVIIEGFEAIIQDQKHFAEPYALLSSINGFKIGFSSWKGMFLGPKSTRQMEKALKHGSDSPLVWKLYANSKLYTPETFGGSVTEAISGFEKSVILFEKDSIHLSNNWMYLDALAHLGLSYQKNNELEKAKTVYEKALLIEPDFAWVSKVLLPKLFQQ